MIFRLLALWLLTALPIQAQTLTPAQTAAQTQAQSDSAAAQRLAEILRDDDARAALIRALEGAASAAPEPEVVQMSLARQLAEYTRATAQDVTAFGAEVAGAARAMFSGAGAGTQINWADLYSAALALALVGVVTIGLFLTLRLLGGRMVTALSRLRMGGGVLRALAVTVIAAVLDGFFILLAWAGGYAFALALGEPGSMDFRQSLFLNGFLLVEMAKVVLRATLAPRHGTLRLLPMGDETAAYWYFWAARLVSLLGYGLLLAVPIINAVGSFALGRSVAALIVVTALLIAVLIVLQNRAPVAAALRARHQRDPGDTLGRIEAFFAGFWHVLAIVYLIALFLIWLLRPADALQFMLAATGQTVVAVLLGVAVTALISRGVSGGMRLPQDLRRNLPLLEDRLNAFVPTMLKAVRIIVALGVVLALGQIWQVMDFLGWVASEAGRDLTGRVVSAVLVVALVLLLWLAVTSFVEYRLNPNVGAVPTARERTLLSLFRNAFTVAVAVIGVMLMLSELGVNIAPLLAGAGVLGLAVGFGAQKLVQDIITGAFIQVENAMNEGDVVTAGGTTGVVEKLTIRSVGLRDLNGTYHLIPFSSVDMVSNFMRGFSYHVANVGVAYREDVSQVKDLMQVAFDRLMQTDHAAQIVGPFEMHGVTELADSAVMVRGRIKTLPGQQWAVGRAYTEIVKAVLDEAGVEIPFPHMTLYMGQEKDGSAAPLNLRRLAPSSG